MPFSFSSVSGKHVLLAYLDLTGSKCFYENSELPEQIVKISQVVGAVYMRKLIIPSRKTKQSYLSTCMQTPS
jgi:hypothetical protein